jgi:transglycosylase-like protein with SLT domain
VRRKRLLIAIVAIAAWRIAIDPAASAPPASGLTQPRSVAALIGSNAANSEIVTFTDPRLPPVRIVRGNSRPPARPGTDEIATFAASRDASVRVLHGSAGFPAAARPGDRPAAGATPWTSAADSEMVVAFADPRQQPVTVLRGSVFEPPDIELFSPASHLDLDRVAFAVDGAESSHGTNPGMWRPALAGPQGPMQVSAAAAFDLGGGDRFDLGENRSLGRAYLARLYRRYGDWPDAIAAYNWGPGNLDAWILGGRPSDGLPLEVERYRDRVLHDLGSAPAPPAPGK